MKELKESLPALEKRYFKLQKGIRSEEARLIEDVRETRPIRKRLAAKEREIRARERGLMKGVEIIEEREKELEGMRAMKEDAFEDYLRAELKTVGRITPPKREKYPEIRTKLDQARKGILSGDIDTAIRRVAEAEVLMNKFKLSAEEKKPYSYDLRYIKASIKLAELG